MKPLLVWIIISQALYAYDFPRSAFELSELRKARLESIKDKEALIFLIAPKDLEETKASCPATVSSSAAKELHRLGKLVIVDDKESAQVPERLTYAVNVTSFPVVIITDAEMKAVYGSYDYGDLKKQEYREIFKDAKESIKTAIDDETFASEIEDEIPTEEDQEKEVEKKDDKKALITIKDSNIQTWESSKGSTIEARLVTVENGTNFTFQTASGKTIKTTAEQLSAESVKKALKLASASSH